MGVYVYTMRKGTRAVEGRVIGQYNFAHKAGGLGRGSDRYERAMQLAQENQFRAADNAKTTNAAVELFAWGDWPTKDGDVVTILSIKAGQAPAAAYDSPGPPGEHVANLRKVGRTWKYEPKEIVQ